MKKSILTILVLAVVTLFSNEISAQNFSSLDKSPMDVVIFPSSHKESNKLVKVYYCRPFLKGRSVASLAPNGKVWRTGANEAVEIRFYQDVIFGGKEVEEGIYTLFTIPGEKEWTIILSSDHNAWGAYSYNIKKDVVRVKAKVSKNARKLENLSIAFEKDMTFCLGWGTTLVKLPMSVED
tara:strand:+ start:64765 stop:65304 length:540 start_codon:yes stop_codon:yes gene_type:complete